MRRLLQDLAPVLHLSRITTAFAAIGNVWFVILWTRSQAEHETGAVTAMERPLWVLLPAGAMVAIGLFVYGAALNDVLDLRRDRAFRPDRPLPSGQIGLDAAATLMITALLAAALGATAFGTPAVLLALMVAGAILVFNAVGKFIPALGLVVLGLIYAGHMLVPNVGLRFVWPVWLVMTHALVVAGATHVLARKVPRLSRRAVIAASLGWVFWSGVLISLGHEPGGTLGGLWPSWVPPQVAIGPAVLVALFAVVAVHKVGQVGPGPRGAEKLGRYGSLWLTLYGCAWLLGSGQYSEGLVLGALALVGLLGMTVLREVYALIEQPIGYRR